MDQSGGLFGQPLTRQIEIVEAINNSQILNNSIPLMMEPGQPVWAMINIRNTGNTAWVPGGNHSLAIINDSCSILNVTRVVPNTTVYPNQAYQFMMQFVAPLTEGPCDVSFRMVEEFIEFFGPTLNLTINVVVPPNTSRDWELFE